MNEISTPESPITHIIENGIKRYIYVSHDYFTDTDGKIKITKTHTPVGQNEDGSIKYRTEEFNPPKLG